MEMEITIITYMMFARESMQRMYVWEMFLGFGMCFFLFCWLVALWVF
jgi:hypothetical protein